MLSLKVWTVSLGLAGAISFVACVGWDLIVPEPLHMRPLLEMLLPGFEWLSPASFLLGLVESFAWGVWPALVVVPIHNALRRRWAARPEDR